MGNLHPFHCCSKDEEEMEVKSMRKLPSNNNSNTAIALTSSSSTTTTTPAAAVVPLSANDAVALATTSAVLPLVSALRKRTSPNTSSLTAPLLDSQDSLDLFPTSLRSTTNRVVRIETSSPIAFVEEDYEDSSSEEEVEEEEEEGEFELPPELPANSSSLRRLLHASQYNLVPSNATRCGGGKNSNATEEKEGESKTTTTPAQLRRVKRLSSLVTDDAEDTSPKFAPFPVDKMRNSGSNLVPSGKMTFAIWTACPQRRGRGEDGTGSLANQLMQLGSSASFACFYGSCQDGDGEAEEEEGDVAMWHDFAARVIQQNPDICFLGNQHSALQTNTASHFAKHLRASGYSGCIILLTSTNKDEAGEPVVVDFSIVDGILHEDDERQGAAARNKIINSIAISLAIAQRRNASSAPSVPPSLQGSWNSTFGFGSIGGETASPKASDVDEEDHDAATADEGESTDGK